MPLLDFTEHRGTEPVIRRFREQFPVLDSDMVNSVVLASDGRSILVFLYEPVELPSQFEGCTVHTRI